MTEKEAKEFLKIVRGKKIVWKHSDGSLGNIITPISLKFDKDFNDYEVINKEGGTEWYIEDGFKKSRFGKWIFAETPTTDFILED